MRLFRLFIWIISITLWGSAFSSDNLRREINLTGKWKFRTGDNDEFAKPDYDDSDWDRIYVPSNWEDHGYDGYDGMAWYRIKVHIPEALKDKMLFLKLGFIDDTDCVYMNGHYIGSLGNLYDKSSTEWTRERSYPINHSYLKFGQDNVIAVQVWDRGWGGGIYKGSIGIYSQPSLDLFLDLTGLWKAQIGDKSSYGNADFNDSQWEEVAVPSTWEIIGWKNIDGFAWYRKHVKISSDLKDKKLVLVLGRIEDSDRVYLNGVLIGLTGNMVDSKGPSSHDSWNKERVYYLPNHLIQWNQINVIAVQVYDSRERGGIYTGPVGITSQEAYLKYQNQ